MADYYDTPDKGFGWVIMMACFGLQVLVSSGYSTFGIFMVEYIEYFGVSKIMASWIGGVLYSLTGIASIFMGPLAGHFGYRPITILGSLLVGLGYICTSQASNIYVVFITHGVITAAGYSCYVISANTAVQHFFIKSRSLAVAVAAAGMSVGVLIWPPLMGWFINLYTWRGALLLLGALNFHACVFGMILRSPRFRPDVTMANEVIVSEDGNTKCAGKQDDEKDIGGDEESAKEGVLPEKGVTEEQAGSPIGSEEEEELLHYNYDNHGSAYLTDLPDEEGEQTTNTLPVQDHSPVENPSPSTKVSPRKVAPGFVKCRDIPSGLLLEKQPEDDQEGSKKPKCTALDLSLLKNPTLTLYYVSVLLGFMGHYAPYTFLPLRSETLMISKKTVSILISLIGICMCIFRIFFGWIADFPRVNRSLMFCLASILAGLVTATSILATDTASVATYCALYSLLAAVYVSVLPTLVGDIVGMKKLASAAGLMFFFMGIGMFISTPLGGLLVDVTDDTRMPFLVLGTIQFFGGCVAIPVVFRLTSQPILCVPHRQSSNAHSKTTA